VPIKVPYSLEETQLIREASVLPTFVILLSIRNIF